MTTKPKSTKIYLGDKVKLDDKSSGWVKFIGPMPKKKGTHFGIELEKAGTGKTAGTFNKKRYFKCKSKTGVFVAKTKIVKSQKSDKSTGPRKTVGDEVTIISKKTKGTIRYIGRTDINTKTLYGIELSKPKGEHNGTVDERKYFKCKDKYGIFVEESDIKTAKKTTKKTGSKKKTTDKKKKPIKKTTKKEVVYEVGDKVEVKPGKKGQIKYVGEAKNLGPGTWYGVRLTEKRGTCDGFSKGHEFFKCEDGFGVYVQKKLLIKKLTEDNDFDFMNEEEEINKKKEEYLKKIKENGDKLQAVHDKFKELDDDGDKSLDREEFSEFAFEVLGTDKRGARHLFDEIDVSNNNEISFAEFDNWLQSSGLIDKLLNEENDDNKENEETQENEENENKENNEETQENTEEEPKQENNEENEETQEENNEEENSEQNNEENNEPENEENEENNEEPQEENNEEEAPVEENNEEEAPVEENNDE